MYPHRCTLKNWRSTRKSRRMHRQLKMQELPGPTHPGPYQLALLAWLCFAKLAKSQKKYIWAPFDQILDPLLNIGNFLNYVATVALFSTTDYLSKLHLYSPFELTFSKWNLNFNILFNHLVNVNSVCSWVQIIGGGISFFLLPRCLEKWIPLQVIIRAYCIIILYKIRLWQGNYCYHSHPKNGEGNISVCQFTPGGVPQLDPIILPLIPYPFLGVPQWLVRGPFVTGTPVLTRGTHVLDWGVPQSWPTGYPSPGQGSGTPGQGTPSQGWGTTRDMTANGVLVFWYF